MVKGIIEYFIKNLIGKYLNIHKKGNNKDIFIFSTRRSGSTRLLELIHSQQGIKYSDQPFDLGHYNPYKNRLPQFQDTKFIHLNSYEGHVVKSYINKILNDEIQVDPSWNLFRGDYNLFTNRYVVKILNANALIGWFSNNFDVQIIYLIRHPIPTALSIIKRNWNSAVDAYLNNEYYKKNYLNDDQIVFAKKIKKNGTELQIYVLEWCLENLVPLRLLKQYDKQWIILSYEELIINYELVINLLCEKLCLEDKEKMLRMEYKPSHTTVGESIDQIQERKKWLMLKRWKNKLSDDEEEENMKILEMFAIDAYNVREFIPNKSLINYTLNL